jgi:hypothetical protein
LGVTVVARIVDTVTGAGATKARDASAERSVLLVARVAVVAELLGAEAEAFFRKGLPS